MKRGTCMRPTMYVILTSRGLRTFKVVSPNKNALVTLQCISWEITSLWSPDSPLHVKGSRLNMTYEHIPRRS